MRDDGFDYFERDEHRQLKRIGQPSCVSRRQCMDPVHPVDKGQVSMRIAEETTASNPVISYPKDDQIL